MDALARLQSVQRVSIIAHVEEILVSKVALMAYRLSWFAAAFSAPAEIRIHAMPVSELVPLTGLDGFTPEVCAKLGEYWITSAQEFISVLPLYIGVNEFGPNQTGGSTLMHLLGLDQAGLDRLYNAAKAAVPSFHMRVMMEDEALPPTGAIFDEDDGGIAPSFAAGEPPPDTDVRLANWPTLDQGERPTCVAFAAVAMYQILAGSTAAMSEQFAYWAGTECDPGKPTQAGIDPKYVLEAMQMYGICPEEIWPYSPMLRYIPGPGDKKILDLPQGPPPVAAKDAAAQRKILGFERISKTDVARIREVVHQGGPVLIGMEPYLHWTQSYQGKTLGRIRPPLPGERPRGGHAMCVVGFRADSSAPGPDKGYFIVRNSWGLKYGTENEDGSGYYHIPYSVVARYNRVAYSITGIRSSSLIPSRVASRPGDLSEARTLLARIQADIARLAEILGQTEEGQR